jgi:hypothetical protein
MKRWLGKLFALLRKSDEARPATRTERSGRAPALEVRTQVKAGAFSLNFTKVT